jgi:hypothetical protein
VHNAEIKTAAVEIKTLTISGKQVTLAVFRQIREERLIAEDGTLNGTPWGTVNYHPGTCILPVGVRDHWHVVWQSGVELRKSTVWEPAGAFTDDSEWASDLVQAVHCTKGHQDSLWRVDSSRDLGLTVTFQIEGLPCWAPLPLSPDPRWPRDHQCKSEADLAEAQREFRAQVAAEKERRARWAARCKEIADLPQLFIAV